jgi:hypothetical protein
VLATEPAEGLANRDVDALHQYQHEGASPARQARAGTPLSGGSEQHGCFSPAKPAH